MTNLSYVDPRDILIEVLDNMEIDSELLNVLNELFYTATEAGLEVNRYEIEGAVKLVKLAEKIIENEIDIDIYKM